MSQKETIGYFKPRQIMVNLDDVTVVGDNPNVMSAQQMQSLEYSIQ